MESNKVSITLGLSFDIETVLCVLRSRHVLRPLHDAVVMMSSWPSFQRDGAHSISVVSWNGPNSCI
jgi:hypothetical protein